MFDNDINGGSVPKEYIKPIEKGIKEAMERGVLAGYEVKDVKVTLYDGPTTKSIRRKWRSRSPVRWRSRKRAARPSPVLLEPVMRVEVVVRKSTWARSTAT